MEKVVKGGKGISRGPKFGRIDSIFLDKWRNPNFAFGLIHRAPIELGKKGSTDEKIQKQSARRSFVAPPEPFLAINRFLFYFPAVTVKKSDRFNFHPNQIQQNERRLTFGARGKNLTF